MAICNKCNGSGVDGECWACKGTGIDEGDSCEYCDGTGKNECRLCEGTGQQIPGQEYYLKAVRCRNEGGIRKAANLYKQAITYGHSEAQEELDDLIKKHPTYFDQKHASSGGSTAQPPKQASAGFTGRQKKVYTDGEYDGEWLNGLFHGKGKHSFSDGETYEGDYVNGKRQGKGKLKFANGNVYEGDWVQDMQNGKGKFKWPSGANYEGDWVNGKWHGRGKYTYANGKVEEGRYENDKFVGK